MYLSLGALMGFNFWLLFTRPRSLLSGLLRTAAGVMLLYTIYLAVIWWQVSYYLILPLVMLYIGGAVATIARVIGAKLLPKDWRGWLTALLDIAVLFVVASITWLLLNGATFSGQPTWVDLPFVGGVPVQ